jgi:magnesium transporter
MDPEKRFAKAFLEAHPDEVTQQLEGMPPGDVAVFLEQLPLAGAVEVLRRMAPSLGADCLERLTQQRACAALSLLPADTAANLLRRMEDDPRQALLSQLPDETVSTLIILLRYPEHTAGAYMDTRVLALPQEMTVGEARARVRRAARQVIYYIYVLDRNHHLAGVVSLRGLMLADGKQPLSEVMETAVARIHVGSGHVEILAHPAWRDVHALPVVDEKGVFLGAIRYRTLRGLEAQHAARQSPSPASLVMAIGELYWLGMGRLVHGLQQKNHHQPEKVEEPKE